MTSKRMNSIIQEDSEYLFQNYGRLPVCFARGEGSFLFDVDGKRYIDFLSGIAVTNLGYANKKFMKRLQQQIGTIIHSSNWFYNREQIEAARFLNELTFPGKTLFVNSGTEANEAAIKLVRRYGLSLEKNRFKIISFIDSFHGRTFGSMSATAQNKIQNGFGPLVPGFIHLPFNDITSFKRELRRDRRICAIFIELIQGEAGIKPANKDFINELFSLCQRNSIITVVDEIQTGMGRTGKPFAYQHYGIMPDIITLAKGLAGGIPIGALHAKSYLAEHFVKGSHGSTFGGNHLACAAATLMLKELADARLLKQVNSLSSFFFDRLHELHEKTPIIRDIRGMGLHIGVEIDRPGLDIVKKALNMGLVINCTSEKVLRIMPPLNTPLAVAKEGMKIFSDIVLNEGNSG